MRWRVALEYDQETGDWAAWCPELPGCASAGETEAEALENIREAIALYLHIAQHSIRGSKGLRFPNLKGESDARNHNG